MLTVADGNEFLPHFLKKKNVILFHTCLHKPLTGYMWFVERVA
jgi:hypothetical protein